MITIDGDIRFDPRVRWDGFTGNVISTSTNVDREVMPLTYLGVDNPISVIPYTTVTIVIALDQYRPLDDSASFQPIPGLYPAPPIGIRPLHSIVRS